MLSRCFIDPTHCAFEDVLVMKYTPRNRGAHIRSRVNSSLLYVERGLYRYEADGAHIDVHEGEMLYIPRGAAYSYRVEGETPLCIQAEFDLYRYTDNRKEALRFASAPTLLPKIDEAARLFAALPEHCDKDTFLTLSILYRLLSLFFSEQEELFAGDSAREKIRPAIEHIERELRFDVSVPLLADMCGLSVPHFRRVFKSLMGKSPIRYKNQTIVKYACKLMESGDMNVSEIANALGFSDVYTFSQTFKKEMGYPPSKHQIKKGHLP